MIIPVKNLLYILPIEDPSSIGTIILPDTHRKTADQGIVKYRGPKTSGDIRVGDHVFYSPWEGDVMIVEGEGKLVLLPEPAVDALFGDGDNPLLPVPTILLGIKRAAAEMMHKTRDTREAQKIDELAARFCEHLSKRFWDELVR